MTAQIIKFDPKFKKPEPQCSFCKTPESKTKKLIGNNQGKFVCDKCLAIMTEQIKDGNN
jgi:hypothetical protein